MEKYGKTCSKIPYQYKMNNKKRVITDKEGLEIYEEEVDDIQDVDHIWKIMHATYKRKERAPGSGIEGRTPI